MLILALLLPAQRALPVSLLPAFLHVTATPSMPVSREPTSICACTPTPPAENNGEALGGARREGGPVGGRLCTKRRESPRSRPLEELERERERERERESHIPSTTESEMQ
ncbi:hypothetical protein E2C01_079916 [Portunus trituberculatus]|uniref:Secreted protein n=1 Tax=Portunus trituberculatus TaxID=210409 RepID=A0A5B7IY70_PORTR|nr:hypothetical protein [Portunus trituberculatus]